MSRSTRDFAFKQATADDASSSPEVSEFFWDAIGGDQLPPGLDYFLFACALSVDQSTALKWLQLTLNISITSRFDSATKAAAEQMPLDIIISGVEMIWRRRMKSLSILPTTHRHHINHINQVKHRALKLHNESTEHTTTR